MCVTLGEDSVGQKVRKREEHIAYFTKEELRIALDNTRSLREKLLVLCLYELGCSLKELVTIRIRDINLELKSISFSHSARTRRICCISQTTANLIRRHIEDQNLLLRKLAYLFSSSHGGHMSVRRVNQIVTDILTRSGFKDRANPQVLKYSHIINAYKQHVPVSAIQRQVGLTRQRLIAILVEVDEHDDLSCYHEHFFDEL